MIKRAIPLALVICLFLILSSPGPVQAQSELAILDNSAQAEFPYKLNFNLSAQSAINITDIRLHYIVDRVSLAQVTSEVYIDFVPAPKIDVSWTWDMRKTGGLPPGSSIEYRWIIKEASGNRIETAPIQVQFDDTRYPWQSLTEGKVTIYYYQGGPSFAGELMVASHQALARLAENTGAYLKKPTKIYIYANTQDLQEAMIYPRDWTGGRAFTRYSTIAIGIAPDELIWGKRAIAHELTHLVIHQMILNPYSGLPSWLDEGLAMHAEGKLELQFIAFLNTAIDKGSLISVRSLSSPFSAYPEQSYLAYAQSYSLVDFLISSYGQEKMLELLNTLREGSSYDEALEKIYGFDTDGLDTLWQDYVTMPAQPDEEKRMHPAVFGVLLALGIGLLLISSFVIKKWTQKQGTI